MFSIELVGVIACGMDRAALKLCADFTELSEG